MGMTLPYDQIHFGLPDSQLRDSLAVTRQKAQRELDLLGANTPFGFFSIDRVNVLIEMAQRAKQLLYVLHGLDEVIASKGWQERDFSDNVNYDKETYFPFLGTEEELRIKKGITEYAYRNFSGAGRSLHIQGQDDAGGGGVLEWCDDLEDAKAMLAKMLPYPRFSNLSIGDL